MITALKNFADHTTMYRLVLYYLLVLLGVSMISAAFGLLPYSPADILFSASVLCAAAWLVNEGLAWTLHVITNDESSLITGLILALILPPVAFSNAGGALDLAVIAAWAVAGKYIFAWGNKHIFNPAALAVVLSAYLLGVPAIWWVAGSMPLLPFMLLGGLLLVYKLRRWDLILSFFAVAVLATAVTSSNMLTGVQGMVLHSAIFFLAFAMLTEPLTMPPSSRLRIIYGAIVGFLFVPTMHLGSFYFTPEIALLVGNVFSYAVSPKHRYVLTLVDRKKLAAGIYEFIFRSDRPLRHEAGQYLEWTLGRVPFDARGNRRYFTIASAPGEEYVRLGVRFYAAPSGFKRALAVLQPGTRINVGALSGDFVLPKDPRRKLAFIGGGIGVTPFASMARSFTLSNAAHDAVLLYASRSTDELAYQDVFAAALPRGLRTFYQIEKPITPDYIRQNVPDYAERLFYISGPPGMVDAMKRNLRALGVSRFSIKTDYFPGLA